MKKVVVSAPVKDGGALNLVFGVNHDLYDGTQSLITAASCTTNCLAPIVKVIHENLRIKHGSITTIHDVTNTQTIVDRPAKDMRRARSALLNLIPTTTGSATAITLIYPELKGRLNGHAVRVPLLNASLTDCVFEVEQSERPVGVNWPFQGKSKEEALAAKGNLGLLLGPKSGVMDVDLDCPEANGLADLILPQPFAKFIRGSSDSGYYLYKATSFGPTQRFAGNGLKSTLVELRGDG